MKLARMTPFGLTELLRIVRETGALPGSEAIDPNWHEEHPASIAVDGLVARIAEWDTADNTTDGMHAEGIHRVLRLPRRVAADRMVWPWLSGILFARYTAMRWCPEGARLNQRRVGRDVGLNSLGRLWWTAEITKIDRPEDVCQAVGLPPTRDPYVLTHLLLANSDLQQGIISRRDLTDRTKLVAMLAYLSHKPLPTAAQREFLRDVGLLFSTVVVEAYESSSAEAPYAVDPDSCREVLELLRRVVDEPGTPEAVAKEQAVEAIPAQSSPRRGLLARLFGKKDESGEPRA